MLFRSLNGRNFVTIFPASHYTTTEIKMQQATVSIQMELEERLAELQAENKLLEAYRLEQRTRYDLEMLAETGFCKGIENYSRHMTGRKPGEPPYTLLDFFPDDYLLFIDESHVTIPQIGAMYHGDRSRKESLVNYGFRLPSAFDNRPLKFEEFEQRMGQSIFVSATPSRYEAEHSEQVVQQVIRPTGLVDPEIVIHPIDGQIDDLIDRIRQRTAMGERSLVLTLTKRMAEDMTDFLTEEGLAVEYLHSDIVTVERLNILKRLRRGEFDVLVGINLLREGLDLPEVSLIAILDADREGFLRSTTSLIQIIGRAARNVNGQVIFYADTVTKSMDQAIEETNRRREIQLAYNKEHRIIPQTIKKDVYELYDTVVDLVGEKEASLIEDQESFEEQIARYEREDLRRLEKNLQKAMEDFAKDLEFEEAAKMRDRLISVRGQLAGRDRI